MRKALVVGGNSGIGLALVICLLDRGYSHVYIIGKDAPKSDDIPNDKVKDIATKNIEDIKNSNRRDFRF